MARANLDSEPWRCAGPCHGQFIGKRPADDVCNRCVTLALTTEAPKRQVVLAAPGAWISGPSITTEQAPAEHVIAGDRIVLNGEIIEITDRRGGWYWIGEKHQAGVALGWRSMTGQSSGVLFRLGTDELERVTNG